MLNQDTGLIYQNILALWKAEILICHVSTCDLISHSSALITPEMCREAEAISKKTVSYYQRRQTFPTNFRSNLNSCTSFVVVDDVLLFVF